MQSGFFERHPSWAVLGYRDFRLLLLGTALVNVVMPFHFLTQVFWVEDHYSDRTAVLYVSLIAASRGLAGLVFSLIGGAIADRFERRRVLLACEALSLAVNGIVALMMITSPFGDATVFAVIVCTFGAAGIMSIDAPARAAAIPSIVGRENIASAISINTLAMQMTLPLSLPLIGVLNGIFAPGPLYAWSLIAWAGILPAIALLRFRSYGGADHGVGMLTNVGRGLRYASSNATILSIVAMVAIIQIVGMPGVANPLGPVWMTQVLGLSKAQFGFMAMTWGIGAMGASLAMARNRRIGQRGSTIWFAGLVFSVSILVFGYSRNVPLTAFANFTLGASFSLLLVSSTTIIQGVVADEMRGRVMALFPLVMGVAQLATAPIGAIGQQIGLPALVPALGYLTLALCIGLILQRPGLRHVRPVVAAPVAVMPE
ncbi:hypothetical protein AYO38_00770 [bacterium SCGC AG-212-C10]|nr:hypothetical protein AYO38_00770 [bacterium SCGC AG-212-C10]